MSQVLILLRKSLLTFARARAAILISFLVPILLIALFGAIFGLYGGGNAGPTGIPLAVVNLSQDPTAQKLIDALRAEKAFKVVTTRDLGQGVTRPLTEADVRAGLHDNWYRYALILPADLMADDAFGIHLKFLFNPRNDIESQMVNGLLQKTIFSNVPQLLGQSLQKRARRFLGDERLDRFNRTIANTVASNFGGDPEKIFQQMTAGDFGFGELSRPAAAAPATPPPGMRRLDASTQPPAAGGQTSAAAPGASASAPANAAAAATVSGGNPRPQTENQNSQDLFSRIVRIDTEQVEGKEIKNPMAARLIGGYAIMFLLMAVGASAATLFEEKNAGVFQRLMASPVRPGHIVWARFLFGMILGVSQMLAMVIAGAILFHLDIVHNAGALLAVGLASAAACSAFGLLVASISPSAAAANGISTLTVLSMSAIGGAWFPTSLMPQNIQVLSKFTLVYWGVEGFADVLWAGRSLLEVLPKVGILAAIAAGVMLVAVWCFNRGKLFD